MYGSGGIIRTKMITQGLEENIRFLRADARRRRLSLITVEHLTLVLIEQNVEVREMLVDCHADVAGVKTKLNDYLASRVPVMEGRGGEPKPSPEFQRVLQRALSRTGKKIGGAHVLAAVFAEPESSAAYYLQKYGIERLTVMSHLFRQSEEAGEPKRRKTRKTDDNLVELATAGELERPLGREAETLDMVRVLSRKYKNNVLLVGEPGGGEDFVGARAGVSRGGAGGAGGVGGFADCAGVGDGFDRRDEVPRGVRAED